MTVVPRRKPKPPERPARRRPSRAPLPDRFPPGRKVAVYEDYNDPLFAGRLGEVVSVNEDSDHIYPHGRVEVRLVIDELYTKLYRGDKPPKTIWFRPNDLEKL